MIDPADNFEIPEEWIALAQISLNELEKQVSKGLLVVLSNGSVLKRGYTTGTTLAAAAKASVLSLKQNVERVCSHTCRASCMFEYQDTRWMCNCDQAT